MSRFGFRRRIYNGWIAVAEVDKYKAAQRTCQIFQRSGGEKTYYKKYRTDQF